MEYKFSVMKIMVISFLLPLSCNTTVCPTSDPISQGKDPNFTIVSHTDKGFSHFNRKVVVWGIDLYAVPGVEDANLLHAAQYLDNDEDGRVDDQLVLDEETIREYTIPTCTNMGNIPCRSYCLMGEPLETI